MQRNNRTADDSFGKMRDMEMNNDIQAGAGTLSRKLPSNVGTAHRIHKNTWKIAFVFVFISLVIDGAVA